MRLLLTVVLFLLVLAGGVWVLAGRATPPGIDVRSPTKQLGQASDLDVAVTAPAGSLTLLDIRLEQGERQFPLFSMPGNATTKVTQESPERMQVTRRITKAEFPELKSGPARLVVAARREALFGLRSVGSDVSRDLVVRLEPPRVGVVSIHHFINHGGSEMVVYRATPPDVRSGVRVGDIEYAGFSAADAGVQTSDPALKVAFFALLYDQDLSTPIVAFARDDAGNEAKANFDFRVFPKPFRKSTFAIDDRFLSRVVPPILDHTPDLKVDNPNDLVQAFLAVNGELRSRNTATIASFASRTAPKRLWEGAFRQLTNSQVEAAFADQRTYTYQGREIDRQFHLGFDLAVTANVPIKAANSGVVLHADYLGIYGNCVIVDHGMGVQSLYGHLSSFDVKAGDRVGKEQTLGRSGMTGLAGGDHLHFTMLVGGHAVTPVDWWSTQWIEDRIQRKIREAGAPADTTAARAAGNAVTR